MFAREFILVHDSAVTASAGRDAAMGASRLKSSRGKSTWLWGSRRNIKYKFDVCDGREDVGRESDCAERGKWSYTFV